METTTEPIQTTTTEDEITTTTTEKLSGIKTESKIRDIFWTDCSNPFHFEYFSFTGDNFDLGLETRKTTVYTYNSKSSGL